MVTHITFNITFVIKDNADNPIIPFKNNNLNNKHNTEIVNAIYIVEYGEKPIFNAIYEIGKFNKFNPLQLFGNS